MVLRAKVEIENEKNEKSRLIISEIPYQVNKANLVEKIADLSKDKKIDGISEIRDESDREGVRIVIDLKAGQNPEVILNNLYAQSQLETSFGINNVAIVDRVPKVLNLKELLEIFLSHRRSVVSRRTAFDLAKSKDRGHILEGLTTVSYTHLTLPTTLVV